MPRALSHELHKLTRHLDRAADTLLRRQFGVSYARFLALFAVRETGGTQRDLARWLGQTEPSTSRMVRALVDAGLLMATTAAGAGNRRVLRLTAQGEDLVNACAQFLEGRFEDLVRSSGVPYQAYERYTRRLLQRLEPEQRSSGDLWGVA